MANSLNGEMIALMRMTPTQFQAGRRRGRIMQGMGVVFAWLLFSGVIFLLQRSPFSPSDLSPHSLPDTLFSAALTAGLLLVAPLMLVLILIMSLPSKKSWFGSRTLRAAVLAGESKYVPATLDQPQPLSADELPRDTNPFLPLKLYTGMGAGFLLALMFILVCFIGFVAIATVEPGHVSLHGVNDLLQFVGAILVFGRLFSAIGRLFSATGGPALITEGWGELLPARRARLLAIDDWGIRWRPRGWRTREQTLAWYDIAAFCVYRLKPGTGSKVFYVYLVMSNDQSFAWVLTPRSKVAVRDASELLSRLVLTRTRRPLLDITKSIETMDSWTDVPSNPGEYDQSQELLNKLAETQNKKGEPFLAQGKLRELLSDLSTRNAEADEMASLHLATIQESAWNASPIRPIRLRARFYWLNILLMLLLASSVAGMWELNQQRLADYYRALPLRIAATTPVFQDSLTSANVFWPLQTPTSADPISLGYAHGGYAITGGRSGDDYYVWPSIQSVDLAVAVTARQIGSSEYDGVGLVARLWDTGLSATDEIVFFVSPTDGTWNLYHFQPGHPNYDDDWQYLDGGNSTAIHTGVGAANRLLLVVRGTEYLCYINGQFVGRDVDSTITPASPKFGYSGLYVNDAATTGVFNDFAIYDAPPPYQPLLHILGM